MGKRNKDQNKKRTIKFSKNWNNKLKCEHFTTIRPHAYNYNKGEYLIKTPNDIDNFEAYVKPIKKIKLSQLSNDSWLTYLDAGLNFKEFYDLMEKFYSDKDSWKYKNTELVLLLVSRKGEEGK